jgi:hypothetical protein
MKKLLIIIVIFLVLVGGVYMTTGNYEPTSTAEAALVSNDTYLISNNDYISFKTNNHTIGIILYPGGKVQPEAYAPLMRGLSNDFQTFIAKMTLNLAVLSPNQADQIIEDHPEISTWYIMGHSLGGVMASQYASENEVIDGLILLASYPLDKHDFKYRNIKVLNIAASKDGLMTVEKVTSKMSILPEDAELFVIEGGNHAQMGDYGPQKNDLEPDITVEEQHQILINKINDFIKNSSN